MVASMLGTGALDGSAPIYLATERIAGGVRFQFIGAPGTD